MKMFASALMALLCSGCFGMGQTVRPNHTSIDLGVAGAQSEFQFLVNYEKEFKGSFDIKLKIYFFDQSDYEKWMRKEHGRMMGDGVPVTQVVENEGIPIRLDITICPVPVGDECLEVRNRQTGFIYADKEGVWKLVHSYVTLSPGRYLMKVRSLQAVSEFQGRKAEIYVIRHGGK